jgi:hypothetical protein
MSTARNAERANMSRRADNEMRRWQRVLDPKERSALNAETRPWGRNGGSVIAPKRRRTRTARRNEKLRREREARLRAEQAEYEARLTAPWKIEKSRAA